MITAEALRRISRREGLPAGIVEKDYAISWFLKETYENTILKEALLFKGGTALKKVYFPETWRLSHDLDFTVVGDLSFESIREGLDQVLRAIFLSNGMAFSLKTLHLTKGSIIASLQFTGPLVHKNRIRIDVNLDEKLILPPDWKHVKTPYPDLPEFKVKVYSLKEILVEKLRSIIQRGKSRDYYDVWRLLKENKFDMNEVRELLIKKCQINEIEYRPELILSDKRLREAKRYWRPALGGLMKELPEFDEAVSELKNRFHHKDIKSCP